MMTFLPEKHSYNLSQSMFNNVYIKYNTLRSYLQYTAKIKNISLKYCDIKIIVAQSQFSAYKNI